MAPWYVPSRQPNAASVNRRQVARLCSVEMIRRAGLVASVLTLAWSASGCWFFADNSCGFQPISKLPVAAIAAPRPLIGQPYATGACSSWVRYNGLQYTDTSFSRGWYDAFSIEDADLTAIGHAESATPQAGPYLDDTVYSIAGVDPLRAVAMRNASTARQPITVLLGSGSSDPPAELCPYFKEPMPADVATVCSQ